MKDQAMIFHSNRSLGNAATALRSILLSFRWAQAQSASLAPGGALPQQEKAVTAAIAKLESGSFGLVDVTALAEGGDHKAVPTLRKRFELCQETPEKTKIASALVELGDKDGACWDFLVKEATAAANSDLQNLKDFDYSGKARPLSSPLFIAWAGLHKVSIEIANEDAKFNFSGYILMLGDSADLRAVPLLRPALQFPNTTVEATAAEGLAKLHD